LLNTGTRGAELARAVRPGRAARGVVVGEDGEAVVARCPRKGSLDGFAERIRLDLLRVGRFLASSMTRFQGFGIWSYSVSPGRDTWGGTRARYVPNTNTLSSGRQLAAIAVVLEHTGRMVFMSKSLQQREA
jgi:hypothetical protein